MAETTTTDIKPYWKISKAKYDVEYAKLQYRTNPQFRAKTSINYYKRVYKGDERFAFIMSSNEDKSNTDMLKEILKFHYINKLEKEINRKNKM